MRDGDVCEGGVGRSLWLLVVRRRGPVMLWWILSSSEIRGDLFWWIRD